ncbi:Uncharacterised protein [Mycolicibacterium phlei]|uniref:hypothetical protein n=1 Tax=Mycobacteroides chelonae TaxID=1774 RepID=UPI000618B2D3|nr:hypothetical protein [Mycobacteroides chelonae]VEG19465.1 Uncharacterised protein [Mycolicibacterium phlei]AKC40104.1 hypothetical protein GR01_18185 [Mycobacteroides chelonae]ANB00967.1 hypothetical protein BB28_19095 [Mycobacteroides chelonae CCUG 47445]OLT82484.1 hypothetical protein BKG56_10570 [Mycobacteroides chelonae]ORV16050.1 hypothetical protein AWB96_08665 [Mycobacteroides chelonae]
MAAQITLGNKEVNLIRSLRKQGVTVPDSVEDELKTYESVLGASRNATETLQSAQAELRTCPASKWDSTLKAFNKAAFEAFTLNINGDNLVGIAAHRLYDAVSDAVEGWEAEIVDKYNAVVDENRLNDVAQDLPDFAGQASMLTLTEAQGKAVELWRSAAGPLGNLWGLFGRLAVLQDSEVGPRGVDAQGTNLFTSCVLGTPGSMSAASNAAQIMVSADAGNTGARAYGPLMPHVIPVLCGYALNLSTVKEAQAIRASLAGSSQGLAPVTQMNYR